VELPFSFMSMSVGLNCLRNPLSTPLASEFFHMVPEKYPAIGHC